MPSAVNSASGQGGGNSCALYVALLSQSGNNAPVATVLQNDVGEIVWAYAAPGVYTATLSNAFPLDKTAVYITANYVGADAAVFGYSRPSASAIWIKTFNNSLVPADELMVRASIEIRVYP